MCIGIFSIQLEWKLNIFYSLTMHPEWNCNEAHEFILTGFHGSFVHERIIVFIKDMKELKSIEEIDV